MPTIYLAGLISTDYPASLEWRQYAESELAAAGATVLNPLRGKANLCEVSLDGGVTFPERTARDIILRDHSDIQAADTILVHLEDFGSPRPLIGTLYELAWCWQLRKPVVAVAKADNYLMRTHPFVSESVAHYLPTIEEAIEFIKSYYL